MLKVEDLIPLHSGVDRILNRFGVIILAVTLGAFAANADEVVLVEVCVGWLGLCVVLVTVQETLRSNSKVHGTLELLGAVRRVLGTLAPGLDRRNAWGSRKLNVAIAGNGDGYIVELDVLDNELTSSDGLSFTGPGLS